MTSPIHGNFPNADMKRAKSIMTHIMIMPLKKVNLLRKSQMFHVVEGLGCLLS